MNQVFIFRLATVALLVSFCLSTTGCGPNFGEKIEVNNTEVYYKNGATKQDAQKLAEMLELGGFVDGKRKSVQLLKRDDVWEFRMAVANSTLKNDKAKDEIKPLLAEVSAVFDGAKAEVHLCNAKLESVSVVTGIRGKRHQLGSTKIYYQGVTEQQVQELSAILLAHQFPPTPEVSFHFSQSGSAAKILMATNAQPSQALAQFGQLIAQSVSQQLFDGKLVEYSICTPGYKSLTTVRSDGTTATAQQKEQVEPAKIEPAK